jgi:hypothetical protein
MRSLTHSSAGFTSNIPPDLPKMSLGASLTPQTPIPYTSFSQTVLTSQRSHPIHSTLNNQPFFDLSANVGPYLFSAQTRGSVNRAIQNSWANSTIKRYSGAIRQYILFCDVEQVPEHLRFPADEFILCAFAASSLGRHAGGTVSSRISALKAWHIAHNMEWKGSPRLRYVLNGVRKLAPGSSKRPPRPPINAKMLSQLVESLDLSSPVDAAVAACAATAFWGQCRLGELLPSSSSALVFASFPIRSGFKRSLRNPQSCFLHLPRTKTHHQGQDIVLVDQRAPINPISLLKNHLRVNNVPSDAHIFSYISADGLSVLSKTTFLQRCNEVWHLLGYPRATGHCFRIGGTTELLIAGIPPDVVKATGRWSSDAFLRYWRSLDDIAPQYVRFLRTSRRARNK